MHTQLPGQCLVPGLITGLITIAYSALLYAAGMDAFSDFWLMFLIYPITLFFLFFFALRIRRRVFGGLWNFGSAFLTFMLIGAIGGLLGTIWTYLLFNVIDPELADDLTSRVMEKTLAFMERLGAPESDIDRTMEDLSRMPEGFSPAGLAVSYAKSLAMYAFIGLIGGLITRRKPAVAVTP